MRGPSKALSKYLKHRAFGQAIVTFEGRDFYLGPHGTQASKIEYDRLIGEWLANERRIPLESNVPPINILELCEHYLRFCLTYYVKNGKPTNKLVPNNGGHLNTLGTALCRAEQWQEAIDTLQKPIKLGADGPYNWLFIAMAHWQLDQKDQAKQWYDKSLAWQTANADALKADAELQGFFAEAAKLMATDAVDKTTSDAEPADVDEDNANEKL